MCDDEDEDEDDNGDVGEDENNDDDEDDNEYIWILTRHTGPKLVWKLWYQIIIDSVLHWPEDYDGSGIIY